MSDMYDLPTGRIEPLLFNRLARCVKRYFTTWDERRQWSRIILCTFPESEQIEIREWAKKKAVSDMDEVMLVLIMFFNAALREFDYRKGVSEIALHSMMARIQSDRSARGTLLPRPDSQ